MVVAVVVVFIRVDPIFTSTAKWAAKQMTTTRTKAAENMAMVTLTRFTLAVSHRMLVEHADSPKASPILSLFCGLMRKATVLFLGCYVVNVMFC